MGAETVVANAPSSLRVRYIHIEQGNKNLALNTAIRDLGDNCLLFFSDDDVRYAPDVLVRYHDAAIERGRGWFFGGPFGVDRDTPPPAWLDKYLPPSARGWEPDSANVDLEHAILIGFNWAAFVGDIRRAGWFDPIFGPGSAAGAPGDEKDMQLRLKRHGAQAHFVEDARVWHYVPVERCTVDWALHRNYRNAITKQLLAKGGRWRTFADYLFYRHKAWSRRLRSRFLRNDMDAEKRYLFLRKLERARGHVRACEYLLFEHEPSVSTTRFASPTRTPKDQQRAA